MKKKLATTLGIMFIGLFFLAFTQGNISDLGSYRSGEEGLALKQQPPTDKGIGPVKELKLGPIDQKLANTGKGIFTAKCAICHAMDQKLVGPPIRNVTKTRSPEYIMNMILTRLKKF